MCCLIRKLCKKTAFGKKTIFRIVPLRVIVNINRFRFVFGICFLKRNQWGRVTAYETDHQTVCKFTYKQTDELLHTSRVERLLIPVFLFETVFHKAQRVFLLINYIIHTLHNRFRHVFEIRFLKRNQWGRVAAI